MDGERDYTTHGERRWAGPRYLGDIAAAEMSHLHEAPSHRQAHADINRLGLTDAGRHRILEKRAGWLQELAALRQRQRQRPMPTTQHRRAPRRSIKVSAGISNQVCRSPVRATRGSHVLQQQYGINERVKHGCAISPDSLLSGVSSPTFPVGHPRPMIGRRQLPICQRCFKPLVGERERGDVLHAKKQQYYMRR